MIEVRFFTDREGSITSFSVEGHAGYAEHGKDIVCAAVSAITQTAVLGLEEYVGIAPEVIQKKGKLYCKLPEDLTCEQRKASEAILKTCYLGIVATRESYSRYLTVEVVKS